MARRGVALLALLALAPVSSDAVAEDTCRVLELDFVPAGLATMIKAPPQIVAWLETPAGAYVDTVFITRQTGTYGLGNRPGRADFNSGPMWPYGRREMVFPIWAYRHPYDFRRVVFQDGQDSNLSHVVGESSLEAHYCQPLRSDDPEWDLADAGTCASVVYTDKGKLSTTPSRYPPRADLSRDLSRDAPDVSMFDEDNPFDAVSQATPLVDLPALVSWSIPPALAAGDYVLWVEVSREFDHNGTFSISSYPAPSGIPFGEWGEPFRGQPSIVYRVPFTLGVGGTTTASTADYVGYSDPAARSGMLFPPDGSITVDVPGSGAQRFALTPGGYRVRVVTNTEPDAAPPAQPGDAEVVGVTGESATIAFVAPGDDGAVGRAKRYEVRLAIGAAITEATFASATLVDAGVMPEDAGARQTLEITDLLFETDYSLAIRAFDDCDKAGPITAVQFTTAERATGEVDACFVASAAYGSALAADVGMLRRFRDLALRGSVLGELAVEAYYTFGPAVAGMVGESDVLRATARAVLQPFVELARGFRM